MVAATRVRMTDLSRQRRYETDLQSDLTPQHTVDHAIRHYLDRMSIPEGGLRWAAFSRGVRLDSKIPLREVPEADTQWTVMPEVSAG
ncbi:MAG: hypothetical protein HUU20_14800 [Pirellulales bacterium]|nr:hypothetical protein [Pirellulales bacterium]